MAPRREADTVVENGTPEVTPEVIETKPEPVVVEVVEQAPASDPKMTEKTLREMEEGRRMLEKFK